MRKYNPKLISQIKIFKSRPPVTSGGYLEMKQGKLCLRRPDDMCMYNGKFQVVKSWLLPGTEPWNTDVYEVR